jgi:hypothetical protein
MAAKKQAQEQTESTVAETPVAEQPTPWADLTPEQQSERIKSLKAEAKLIAEQIQNGKAAHAASKPARPTQAERLAAIAQRQAAQPKWIGKFVRARVQERVKAGQSRGEAIEQVLAFFRSCAEQEQEQEQEA